MKRKADKLALVSLLTIAFAGTMALYGTYQYFMILNQAGIDFSWMEVVGFLCIGIMGRPFAFMKADTEKDKRGFDDIIFHLLNVVLFLVALWYSFHKIGYGFALPNGMLGSALLAILGMLTASALCYLTDDVLLRRMREAIKKEEKILSQSLT